MLLHFFKCIAPLILIFSIQSVSAQVCSEYVADDFNSGNYITNTGSQNWTGNWTEVNNGSSASDPDGTNSGMIRLQNGQLRFEGIGGADPYLMREANLSGTTNAMLCFDIHTSGNLEETGNTDQFAIEASGNGGTSWTNLETINGDITDVERCHNISALATANTQIRFYTPAYVNDGNEYFYIDNVFIKYDDPNTTSIYGYAWEDWDFNGSRDESCVISVAGLDVEIWSCDDMLIGTTTTDSNGNWSFDLASMPTCNDADGLCDGTFASNCIRVEYKIPESLCHLKFTQAGPDNGTSVQFIKPGGCAPIGLARPDDYCEDDNPTLLTSCFASIRPESTSNEPAIVYWDYNNRGTDSYSTAAHYDNVGAIWGIAYNNNDDEWYYSSLLKRHVGLGTDGIGAIYVQSDLTNTNGVSTLYDFGSAAGSIGSNSGRGLPTTVGNPSYDTEAFWKSGKAGLGDIEYSPDTEMLYAMNLNDRQVYQIDPNAGTVTATPLGTMPWISNSPCTDGTARPWALKTHNKKLYAGVVCDAAGSGGTAADLTAHMYCYDFVTSTWNITPRLSFDLDYERQPSASNPDGSPRDNSYNGAQWHPWEDNYNNWTDFESGGSYAQPIFSDIEFDDNGDVILGFIDRGSLQMGNDNYRPQSPYGPGGSTLVTYVNAGDILRAGLDDTSADPTYSIENNGITNGVHKTKTSSRSREDQTSNSSPQTLVQTQDSGPGGLEFYWGERALLHHNDGFRADHLETALGALTILRGSGEVVATIMDPQINEYPARQMGLHFLDNTTGYWNDAKRLSSNSETNLSKSIALGDIELCCQPPPIQVGNFVWLDLDMDGIQDPCEPGLAGVTVSLYLDDGAGCCTYLSSVNTDADGQYYFDDLDPNTTYHIVVGDDGDFDTTSETLSSGGKDYSLTTSNVNQSGNTTDPDNVDSDGVISSNTCCGDGYPTTEFTTGVPGDNDHSLDFGFIDCPVPTCTVVATTLDCNADADATITVTGSGGNGTGAYEYQLGTGAFQTSNIFINNGPGTYTITIRDTGEDCSSTCEVTITEPAALSCTTSVVSEPTCDTLTGGSAAGTATGGTGPYTYSWSSGGTAATETGLSGGNYSLTVTDANDCTSICSVTITTPAGCCGEPGCYGITLTRN